MQTDALAQIYAKSLYELADEAGGLEKITEIGEELEQICEVARSESGFAEFMASPIINTGRRSEVLSRVFRDQITDLTLRFLLVVNAKGRLGHLEQINAAYDQLVQEAHGRVEVDVYTASPLEREQIGAIEGRIREALQKDPVLHLDTDESMLGGLMLRVGDRLIDGSVATRLRRMEQAFLTSGTATIRDRFDQIVEEGGGA